MNFYDDFFYGTGIETAPNVWTNTETSNGVVDVLADQRQGQVRLLTTTASEDQVAQLDFNDNRCFDIGAVGVSNFAQFECRFMAQKNAGNDVGGHHFTILLAGNGIALTGDNNLDGLNVYVGIEVGASFSSTTNTETLTIRLVSEDTTTTEDEASGSSIVLGTYYNIRVDLTDLSDPRFYLDGVDITAGTHDLTALVAATESYMQPMIVNYKHTTEGDSEAAGMYVDDFRFWSLRP
jgi:hypothetical protein